MKPCKLFLGRAPVICLSAAGNVPIDAPCPWCHGRATFPDWVISQPGLDRVGGEWFEVTLEGVTFTHVRGGEWHADVGGTHYVLWPCAHGYGALAHDAATPEPDRSLITSAEDGETPTLLHAVAWVLGRAGRATRPS